MFLFFSIGFSGCGYQLRGGLDTLHTKPLQYVFMHSIDLHPSFIRIFKQTAITRKITFTKKSKSALHEFHLSALHLNQQLLSVAASNGPRQFQLSVSITLTQNDAKNRKYMKVITVNRVFTQNSNTLLGSNDEQTQIIQSMYSQLSQQICTTIRIHHDNT